MDAAFAFIGFGEAGAAFAGGAAARGYDRKTDDRATRDAKLVDFDRAGVRACADSAEAVAGIGAVLSLVTADQALAAAQTAARRIARGTLWFDMNSVAPDTKRAAAEAIEAGGGRYVDVAVMAPVHPKRLAVPLLIGGPHAEEAAAFLATIGFTDVTQVSGPVGQASSIKMIRSVMVKGIEALTAECFLAADAAGVGEAVRTSLDASWPGTDWESKADYNLDRMMVHGLRRAAEMEEVVKTLDSLGSGSAMTRGTIERQRAIGGLGLTPQGDLAAKLTAIRGATL
ncbi:DUF1932 domain-containing protein [Sphingomonas sp. M1-B02]|uniref:DUF1932 domain-containing protein n=1 Tax=Sphingomonas sp. M1-B02 TaxID=3114300 RepID=UPI002240C4DE|nr:NAD(P)-dependent oxidoreductase [Sphingomonas sp. S6-11]UZK65187.1 DUF1932 domain-containing protein [Sphingomonas sp. S6-11]